MKSYHVHLYVYPSIVFSVYVISCIIMGGTVVVVIEDSTLFR